jgi:ATP-dependent DNA helicase DinG
LKSAKEQIHDVLNRLESLVPNYRRRQSQYTMIAKAATLFGRARTQNAEGEVHGHVIEVDAPTGTGKSQGYLIPGIVMSRRLEKKLVVSSSTVGLQEQLRESDLPLLKQCFDGGLSFVIAKGRTRYVCPYRMEHEASEAGQYSLLQEGQQLSESEAKKRDETVLSLHEAFSNGQWDGDRDSLGRITVDDTLWRTISTDRHGCSGAACPKINQCPFYKARGQMDSADVIVTNHDLLLADLSLGGGVILPDPENTIYCIDEAHHLPEKAVQSFSAFHSVKNSLILAERMVDFFSGSFPIQLDESVRKAIVQHGESLHGSMTDLHSSLSQISWPAEPEILRFPFGEVPEAFYMFGANITVSSNFMFSALQKINELLMEAKEEGRLLGDTLDRAINDVAQLTVRLETIYKVWTLMLSEMPEKAPPIAKWVKPLANGDFLVCASPISAASMLKNLFFDKAHAALLTSATLTTLGKFDLFNHKSGLGFMKGKVESVQLPSPFDFSNQAKLIVPAMFADPKKAPEHTAEVMRLIPSFIPMGQPEGTLVLFSSRKQMEDVYSGMLPNLRKHVLLQGVVTKDELIRQHKAKIDNGEISVLFGLAGLSEGLDLPGKYCSRVIIAKIPFSVPTNPIEAAEAEWLESVGRNAFSEVTVPAAGMKLAQSVGRLIRTESDYGEVIILDTRLVTTNYGKMLLKGLPPFTIDIQKRVA